MSSLVNAAPNREGTALSLSAEVSLVKPLAAARTEIVRLRKRVNQLEQQLGTDELTGIANRRALYTHARQLSAAAVVAVVDLDQFKPINDQHGHHVGDAVLRTVARRLRTTAHPYGFVARLGGDEFALIIEQQAPHQSVIDIAHQLLMTLVRELGAPMKTTEYVFTIGLSIGAAVLNENDSFATVLHRADIAMYRAKTKGGGIAFYDPALDAAVTAPPDRPRVRARDLPTLTSRLRHVG